MKKSPAAIAKPLAVEAKPLVLLASSRPNGNTAALVNAAFPEDSGTVIDISALQIGYFSYTNRCADDDFIPLIERAVGHSLWVIATPLYWYTMSAQAKTFLDRLSDLLEFRKDLGRKLRGKRLAVMSTGIDVALPSHLADPFALTADYLGMRYVGQHYAKVEDGTTLSIEQQDSALRFARGIAGSGFGSSQEHPDITPDVRS